MTSIMIGLSIVRCGGSGGSPATVFLSPNAVGSSATTGTTVGTLGTTSGPARPATIKLSQNAVSASAAVGTLVGTLG